MTEIRRGARLEVAPSGRASGIQTMSRAEPPHEIRHQGWCDCGWRGGEHRGYWQAREESDRHAGTHREPYPEAGE